MSKQLRPPKDGLVRSVPPVEVRDAGEDAGPILEGYFARFDEWTEIKSAWEGNFMERIAPGAFRKSFKETTPKVLLNHGADPVLADKPLGRVDSLAEDDEGARYEVALYRGIDELVMEGLRDGAYGASFRFRVVKEELNEEPDPSDANPHGIPERTIKEAQVMEFGPVTFPAYEGATAGVRSLTDDLYVERLKQEPERVRELLELVREDEQADGGKTPAEGPASEPAREDEALSEDEAGDEPHSDGESRATTPTERPQWSLKNHGKEWRLP